VEMGVERQVAGLDGEVVDRAGFARFDPHPAMSPSS
jgi:hypothetical protein